MEPKTYHANNDEADLEQSWHIPRPTLARSTKSSRGSLSSNDSTQSTRTGSLLLTAANLAQIHASTEKMLNTREQNIQYYLEQHGGGDDVVVVGAGGRANPAYESDYRKGYHERKPDADNVSVASSMHFTVVNMNTRSSPKRRSFCRKHQLTILIVTMCVLFTIGILAAVCFMELRARRKH